MFESSVLFLSINSINGTFYAIYVTCRQVRCVFRRNTDITTKEFITMDG